MPKGKKFGGRDFVKGDPRCHRKGPIPGEIIEARKINKRDFEITLSKIIRMTKAEMKSMIEHPITPMLEVLIGTIIAKAASTGNYLALEFILNRLLGRVRDAAAIEVMAPTLIVKYKDHEVIMGAESKLIEEKIAIDG